MNKRKPLRFKTLAPYEEPVEIENNDGKQYILREASEDQARQFKNAGMRAARFEKGEVTGIEAGGDMQSLLISFCLFEISGPTPKHRDGKVPVSLSVIRQIPHSITKPLFKRCLEISDLEEKKEETKDSLLKKMDDLRGQLEHIDEHGELFGPEDNAGNLLNSTTDGSG
jgi:hypothetical protein